MTRCGTIIYFTPSMTEAATFHRDGLQLGKPQAQGGNHLGFRFDVDDQRATFDRFPALGPGSATRPSRRLWVTCWHRSKTWTETGFGLVQR